MHLNISIDDTLGVLERYSLTPTELFVLKLLLISQDDADSDCLERYLNLPEECKGSTREVLESLQNKGIILKSYRFPKKGEFINIYDIPIAKNVVKFLYTAAFELGLDLFNHYPDSFVKDGKYLPIKSVDKNFNTLEDSFRYYGKTINWSIDRHKKIIDLLEWGKDRGYITFTLASFIISRRWEYLEKLKDGDISNTFDYSVDA